MSSMPALELLSGAYLNEDWPADYPNWQAAVDDFIAGSPTEARLLPAEITRFLAEHPDETDVKDRVLSQGFGYLPRADEGGYRGILAMIAHRIELAGQRHSWSAELGVRDAPGTPDTPR